MQKYILLTRNNSGFYLDKVSVMASLEFSKEILQSMVLANKNANRAEIIEGDRDYIGDFRVKPLRKFYVNFPHRDLVEEIDENN